GDPTDGGSPEHREDVIAEAALIRRLRGAAEVELAVPPLACPGVERRRHAGRFDPRPPAHVSLRRGQEGPGVRLPVEGLATPAAARIVVPSLPLATRRQADTRTP